MDKIWFAGSGPFASECLRIISSVNKPHIIITAYPKRAGRGMKLKPTPVEKLSLSLDLPVHHTSSMSTDPMLLKMLKDTPPLAIVVIDFGQKILTPFLDFSELGCLNIHPSLLPEYRGAAPVQRAIMNGRKSTGVTLFRLTETMDSGPVLSQASHTIANNITSGDLLSDLADMGCVLLLDAINNYIPKNTCFLQQDHSLATFAPKIRNEEARLDVMQDAASFHNKVRAMNPEPGAYICVRGKRVKIWQTSVIPLQGEPGTIVDFIEDRPVLSTIQGCIVIINVQPEGKTRMDAASWARGARLLKGDNIL